jgi:hypothetical protein
MDYHSTGMDLVICSSTLIVMHDQRWRVPMNTMILAALIALSLGAGAANAQAATYHAPAHNFYQNNWVGSN